MWRICRDKNKNLMPAFGFLLNQSMKVVTENNDLSSYFMGNAENMGTIGNFIRRVRLL